jgi:HlyD family secretion protein
MKNKRPRILFIIIIIVLVLLVGGYFGFRALFGQGSTPLTASGTIEAIEVTISPEIGGKVAAVPVNEGSQVKAGDILFRLDDTLLKGQRAVAAATLDVAKAAAATGIAALATAQENYTVTLDAVRTASASTRTSEWWAANPDGYTLPGGYFTRVDEIASAQAEVTAAGSARDSAQISLNSLINDPGNSAFVTAEARLSTARAASLVAQDVLTRANASSNFDLRNAAQSASDAAQTELINAQSAYDGISNTDAARKIISARANLSALQERVDSAQDRLTALQTGENSPQVAAAQAVLNQAQAAADQATQAILQSKTNLDLIDIQIAKLTIIAPADGVILSSSIQPGEITAPNSPAMTLGRLDSLTITVYIPENLYGEISLGQPATMAVDSYTGETFAAAVINIAEQAEFTPRNVQTVEGRSSTVFAIKLQIQDPSRKLKPGMPADVKFH